MESDEEDSIEGVFGTIIVLSPNKKIVHLLLICKDDGKLGIPGGRKKLKESCVAAMKREYEEEVGISLDFDDAYVIPYSKGNNNIKIRYYLKIFRSDQEPLPLFKPKNLGESFGCAWIPFENDGRKDLWSGFVSQFAWNGKGTFGLNEALIRTFAIIGTRILTNINEPNLDTNSCVDLMRLLKSFSKVLTLDNISHFPFTMNKVSNITNLSTQQKVRTLVTLPPIHCDCDGWSKSEGLICRYMLLLVNKLGKLIIPEQDLFKIICFNHDIKYDKIVSNIGIVSERLFDFSLLSSELYVGIVWVPLKKKKTKYYPAFLTEVILNGCIGDKGTLQFIQNEILDQYCCHNCHNIKNIPTRSINSSSWRNKK